MAVTKETILKALQKAKSESKERKFNQTVDVIFNLKDIDLKKTDNQVDFYANFHHGRGKKIKVCAFVGPELKDEAEQVCDKVIPQDDFANMKDKKELKKLAGEYDFFISQANIMGAVATTFGKTLGPRGKMPNPKAGCVVPPKAQLKPLYEKLQHTRRITAKTQPSVKCPVGKQDMPDEQLVDNIFAAYSQLTNHLPNHDNNIKQVLVKTTMGKPVLIE